MSELKEPVLLLAIAVSGGLAMITGALLLLVSSLSTTLTDNARMRIAGMGNLLSILGGATWLLGVALAIYAVFRS